MSTNANPEEKPHFIKNGGEYEAIKSAIPEHLVADSSPAEQHIVSSISILEQRSNMSHENEKALDEAVGNLTVKTNNLDGRVEKIEDISEKVRFSGKSVWVIILALGGFIAFIFKAVEFVKGLLK